MPTRIQSLKYGLGSKKQASISALAATPTFNVFRKLDMDVPIASFNTETDEDEIGKGHEFITQVFPTAWDFSTRCEKYGSAEFVTWAWAYALGNVSFLTGTYTITPIDPGTTLELPYFGIVSQLNEGGSSAIDELYLGCAIESVETTFNYGVGRQSIRTVANIVGSGRHTFPSAQVLGSPLSEHYMVSQSAAININGHDYVSDKTILSGTLGWNNNLLLNAGYYPGSGVVSTAAGNAAVRGRIEIGKRVPTFTFVARLLNNSPEYAALQAQTSGTAIITFTFDSTHTITFTWEKVTYRAVTRGEADGIVTVQVTVAPQYDSVNGVLSISAQCGISDIAQ